MIVTDRVGECHFTDTKLWEEMSLPAGMGFGFEHGKMGREVRRALACGRETTRTGDWIILVVHH